MTITATPHGRMRRTEYAATLVVLNFAILGASSFLPGPDVPSAIVRAGLILPLAWLLYCAMSRRLHDAGRGRLAAGLVLAGVVVGDRLIGMDGREASVGSCVLVASSLLGLVVLIAPPTASAVRFGPDPRSGRRHVAAEGDAA